MSLFLPYPNSFSKITRAFLLRPPMSPTSFQNSAGPGALNQHSRSPPSASNVSSRDRQGTAESDIEAREENGASKAPLRKKQRKQRPVFSCAGMYISSWSVLIARSSFDFADILLECRRLKLKCDRQGE